MELNEAIEKFVKPNTSVVIGASHEHLIPFCAVYEIIRQGISDLTVIAPISDAAIDMLIGAGNVSKVVAAWVGDVTGGIGYNLRRAVEEGIPKRIEVIDHSNYTLALALLAGAMGIPFLPTRTILGTDIVKKSKANFEIFNWHGIDLVAVPALNPDLTILAVQKADINGNAIIEGPIGLALEASMSSDKVLIIAEEITEFNDLERITIPSFLVKGVVHTPFCAHPSPAYKYYGRDTDFLIKYHESSRSREGFLNWLNEWVLSVKSHDEYLKKLGFNRLKKLREDVGLWSGIIQS